MDRNIKAVVRDMICLIFIIMVLCISIWLIGDVVNRIITDSALACTITILPILILELPILLRFYLKIINNNGENNK